MSSEILKSLPLAVCTTDALGRITFFNDAAAELWGHRPELGSSGWSGAWRVSHPDGRPMHEEDGALALALREGQPARVEAVAERSDGRRVHFRSIAAPVRDAAGAVSGAVQATVEASERTEAEIGLARLAAIVASSDDAIISKTLEGVVTSWNAGATRIFGYEAEEMIGQPIVRIIPAELRAEEEEILARLRRGERIDHFDTERIAKDGHRVFISLTVSPIRNGVGEVVGASKVARDVTERKRAEEMQELLLGELNHRVKNILATIQAVARQSLRMEPSPGAFVASFTGRLQALARAHDILVRGEMQRAELAVLVREQVGLGASDPRTSWSGPAVVVDSRTALQLAMVLHELATNARKYGALSQPAGRLAITWTSERVDGGNELLLEWRETGARAGIGPVTRGFGTLLIERSLLSNGGTTAMRYLPDGFVCEIRLPLSGPAPGSLERSIGSLGGDTGTEGGAAVPLAGLRILVVEDEPLIAMDIEEQLLAAGGDVIGPATNLETARRLIAETVPDAALLDANLAGHRVDALASELRRRGIPFAFATGFGRASLPEAFRDAPVLAKPFGSEEMVAMVRALLAGREGTDQVISFRPRL